MKKNFLFALALGAAMTVTSCDQNNTTEAEATAAETTATAEQPQQIDNPNVVPTSQTTSTENAAVMTFEESEYDFGTIKQGEVVEHTFTFTNTGKTPLVIESASASCGCTAPDWTKDPVAPGQKGEVKVRFDSNNKAGQQAPTVTIRANTEPNIVRIAMKGNVATSSIPTAGADGPVRLN
ncbi:MULTISPECIES: DUF1573 domain-containing protein [Pontibacter]|uniref:DUF1573 domain-containing protein n=1 Tax=Pontibacter lucknowensis TaxID=1077936 RepID=A0A1N6UII4_9BACT|nr:MULTISPECIES: DUF1573 domain-containing protein [Pontibacter]EJF10509.1 hypothetical protein O71_08720 [Pontibacter sp. BAB1700]SIQ65445.1 Protein of unknown function [Pontibacter lucknowensis]